MESQSASSDTNAPALAEPVQEVNPPQANSSVEATEMAPTPAATEPKPSYVKLAMRNMVRKRGLSLQHFALTTIGLLAVLVGLSYLTR